MTDSINDVSRFASLEWNKHVPEDKPQVPRVVIEIDSNGFVDLASDLPVHVVILNRNNKRYGDGVVTIQNNEVDYTVPINREPDPVFVEEVWQEVAYDLIHESKDENGVHWINDGNTYNYRLKDIGYQPDRIDLEEF